MGEVAGHPLLLGGASHARELLTEGPQALGHAGLLLGALVHQLGARLLPQLLGLLASLLGDVLHLVLAHLGDVAGWLDQRDPGSLVSEVKQFARQRPGAFLAAAALAGLVGGRLSRGLVADHQEATGASDEGQGGTPAYATGSAYATGAGTAGYVETVGPVGTTGVPTTSTAPVGDGTEYSDYGSPLDGGESPR